MKVKFHHVLFLVDFIITFPNRENVELTLKCGEVGRKRRWGNGALNVLERVRVTFWLQKTFPTGPCQP